MRFQRTIVLVLVSLSGLIFPRVISADEFLSSMDGKLRLSHESLAISRQEQMGLVGMSTLLELGDHGYSGLSAFGAISGQRGGFFTGGFSSGLTIPVYHQLSIDTGLFIGGGGGGAAPQGGGLMFRAHAGVEYTMNNWHWGLQWSRIQFPNGAIDSTQLAATLSRSVTFNLSSGWASDHTDRQQPLVESNSHPHRRLALTQSHYFPTHNVRDTTGTLTGEPIRLLGFTIDFIQPMQAGLHPIYSLQTAGALSGESDGYAEVLWAFGYRYRWDETFSGQTTLALGAGGGGRVASGGGLLSRLASSFTYSANKVFQYSLVLGYVEAPQGDFRAEMAGFEIAYAYGIPGDPGSYSYTLVRHQHWRVSAVQQTYISVQRKSNMNQAEDRVELVGNKIDWMLSEHFYISGSAMAAYSGSAGGYATGQFGVGWQRSVTSQLAGNVELLAGAGGGGGIAVSGGALLQAQAGLEWLLDKKRHFSLMASYGHVQATKGGLNSPLLNFSLAWRLSSKMLPY